MKPSQVTTAFDFPGHRIVRNIGVCRGLVVRSRSVVSNFVAGIQTIFGGNISIYTSLCEEARKDTYLEMCRQATRNGANAIVGMRYDTADMGAGLTEVICYGTAVVVVKLEGEGE